MRLTSYFLSFLVVLVLGSPVWPDDALPAERVIKAAINKSIPLLEKGALGSSKQRKCFTCHNQAMPLLALAEAQKRGFSIDKENFQKQLEHTSAHLERGKKKYLEGRGQGGQVISAGYALWALEAGGYAPDDLTAAVVHYLLEYQKSDSHWQGRGSRPPSSGSDFTTTYVAMRALATFGTSQQQKGIDARNQQISKWLLREAPSDTEDRVFRLWALPYVEQSEATLKKAITELVDSQQEDGGWAQKSDMKSDAYATATVMVALLRVGDVDTDHAAIRRGMHYLLDTQGDDGSWQVKTRAKPFQTHYESGFPHGKDQFISISASSWATLALVLTLP